MNEVKIQIAKVDEIEIKERNLKFLAYKTITKNGKFMDVRFTRNVTNAPKAPCVVVVDEANVNVDDQRKYPIMWVSEIKRIEPLASKKSNIGKYLDVDEYEELPKGEELPF